MNKLKYYLIGILIAILAGLGIAINIQSNKIKQLNSELLVSVANNKAYEAERDSLRSKTYQFQFTIDQLNQSKDSLIQRMNTIRKQLNVKDKQLLELQHIASTTQKSDSIIVHDTLFVKNAVLDTLIGDDWSQISIHAEYPNILQTEYMFKNSTNVFVYNNRVTVGPPKKCWLLRLFQKKQDVVEINVVQENPYCVNKEEKFIKIIE